MVNQYSKYNNTHHFCYYCGSDETYINKNKKPNWHINLDIKTKQLIGFLCHKCWTRLINNVKWNPICNDMYKGRIISYKGKNILVSKHKKGICSKCGAVKGVDCKRTSIHHIKYHDDDPLRDTIELCNKCHLAETINLKQIDLYKSRQRKAL